MVLTLTYESTLSRVRASANGLIDAMTVSLQRSTDQIRWATVRGGAALVPASGVATLDDYEFSPDVINYYRVRGGGVFDNFARTVAAGGWGTASSGQAWTVAGTAADYSVTSGVGRISTVTINSLYLARVEAGATDVTVQASVTIPVVPTGNAITARVAGRLADVNNYYEAQVFVGTSGAVTLAITKRVAGTGSTLASVALSETHSAGNTWHIKLDVAGSALSAKAWKSATEPDDWQVETTDTSLTTGTQVAALARRETGNTNGTVNIDFDNLVVESPATTLATANITPALGGVWLKSISRPFLNQRATIVGVSEITRPSRTGVFEVMGRSNPVAVSDVRGSRRWTYTLLTETAEAADNLDLLVASGDTVFVHVPADQNVPGGYVSIGESTELRFGSPPERVWTLPVTEVAAPGPDVVGTTATWQSIINNFGTWADVIAEFPTWTDVLEYVADHSEVIVP
jgi:hypothetical protein